MVGINSRELRISNSVDEKQKRILLGKATEVYGRGGATHVKELTGVAFSTLHSGNIEANSEEGIVSNPYRAVAKKLIKNLKRPKSIAKICTKIR